MTFVFDIQPKSINLGSIDAVFFHQYGLNFIDMVRRRNAGNLLDFYQIL